MRLPLGCWGQGEAKSVFLRRLHVKSPPTPIHTRSEGAKVYSGLHVVPSFSLVTVPTLGILGVALFG